MPSEEELDALYNALKKILFHTDLQSIVDHIHLPPPPPSPLSPSIPRESWPEVLQLTKEALEGHNVPIPPGIKIMAFVNPEAVGRKDAAVGFIFPFSGIHFYVAKS
jgi:hypothetical protein